MNLLVTFKNGQGVECEQTEFDKDEMKELVDALTDNEGLTSFTTNEGEFVINLDEVLYIRIKK